MGPSVIKEKVNVNSDREELYERQRRRFPPEDWRSIYRSIWRGLRLCRLWIFCTCSGSSFLSDERPNGRGIKHIRGLRRRVLHTSARRSYFWFFGGQNRTSKGTCHYNLAYGWSDCMYRRSAHLRQY